MLTEIRQNRIGILAARWAWQNRGNIHPAFLLKLTGLQSIRYGVSHGAFYAMPTQ